MAEYILNGRNISRGQLYYIEYEETVGSEQSSGRPAVIVSCNANNNVSQTVEVVYMTTRQKNPLPTHVKTSATGRESTVLCEQIHTVDLCRVGNLRGRCTSEDMVAIDHALLISIGLERYLEYERLVPELRQQVEELAQKYDTLSAESLTLTEHSGTQLQALQLKYDAELQALQLDRDRYKALYSMAINELALTAFSEELQPLIPVSPPSVPTPSPVVTPEAVPTPDNALVNINTANEAELTARLNIPKSTARWIITYREKKGKFNCVDDLIHVTRIGAITYERISPLITVQEEDEK